MQKRTLLAALATAAAVAVITPSLSQAQDTTQKTSKGEVAMGAPSFGSLISAINSTAAKTDKIKGMTEVNAANVQLVNVDNLLKGQDANALNEALKKNEADITTLRTTLGANTGIAGVLTANAVPLAPTDVIAADVGGDGKVTLFYWKKTS